MRAHTNRTVRGGPTQAAQVDNSGKGKFHSLKMNKVITYNNQIEQDFLYLLDYEADVKAFRVRPFSIEIPAPNQQGQKSKWPEQDETWVRYTPDFAVDILPALPAQPYTTAGPRRRRASECAGARALIVEVLSSTQAATPAAHSLFDTLASWCKDRTYGLEFCYLTDRQIRAGCYLENIKLLRQFSHHIIQPETRARIYGLLEDAPDGISIGELALAIDSLALDDATGCILHLAYQHEITIPMDDWVLSSQSRAYSPYRAGSFPIPHPLTDLLRKAA